VTTAPTESELRDVDGAGYQAAIAAGAQTVMASYSSWQGVKMHGYRALLTDVLRVAWASTVWCSGTGTAHAQLPGCTPDNCAAALNAGLDVFMGAGRLARATSTPLAQVTSGEISAARLDDAVRRVLRVKLRAHLDREGRPSSRPFAGRSHCSGRRRIARWHAGRCASRWCC